MSAQPLLSLANCEADAKRYARPIDKRPTLIIQVPRDSAIERQLHNEPPGEVSSGDVLVQTGPTDDQGFLEAMAGQVVLSVPSPEELNRQTDELARVLRLAGTGTAPLVVVIEAAEEIRREQATALLAAAREARRPVILRVIRPSER